MEKHEGKLTFEGVGGQKCFDRNRKSGGDHRGTYESEVMYVLRFFFFKKREETFDRFNTLHTLT